MHSGSMSCLWSMVLLFGAAACVGPAEFVNRPPAPIAWPSVADARIALEFGYHDAGDVERHPGFWAGLVDLIVGAAQRELVAPRGLAWAEGDILWIADPGCGAVHRLSLSSGEHRIVDGSEAEPFASPIDVASTPTGRVFVTDSVRARVVELAADGAVVGAFGEAATLGRPTGIAYDPHRDRLLVVDTTGCRILAVDLEGRILATAGRRGVGLGEFNFPTFLCVLADGCVAVVDSMNFRVQILGPDLEPRSQFGEVGRGPGTFASPKGIAVDRDGHLYVVDALFDNIQIFDRLGRLLLPVGEHGHELGRFSLPSGICFGPDDRMVVADGGNARIQLLRYIRREP